MLRDYYRIKQSDESEEMAALLYYIARELKRSDEAVKTLTIQCLNETDGPIEFIACIKKAP